jgi:gamma-glutamylcyclotransferase (GGCT)/AIG2-like uncharacterized protein YtfP
VRLFVYGTLRDPACLEQVIGRRVPSRPARLLGYERREAAYPYVVESPDGVVDGLLLDGLDDAALARLDRYEDEGRLYARRSVTVEVGAERVPCDVYVGRAIAGR